ncbi:MAG: ComF family protein [Alphaproteobacteria bacterium]|nr:ComF family protein [Alphaproteobacteria bacterium]
MFMGARRGDVKAGVVRVRAAGALLADFLFPPVCAVCAQPVQKAHTLCAPCWRKLEFISAPLCPRLGIPFAFDLGPGTLSAEAIARPPPFDRARSAVRYGPVARRLIGRLKYGDRTELVRLCASLMGGAGDELFAPAPLLVAVPLHWRRRLARRFNQSNLLALEIGRTTGLDIGHDVIVRHRHTKQQVGLNARQRAANVAGAFSVAPGLISRVAGRPVLLVEDVITTGATINEAARVLKKAGVDRIDVLSFARVVGDPV